MRRTQVSEAARLLFVAHGFQNTRMSQIAAASGIKVGQIYRDFDGKEAIVAEIVRADLADFLDEAALDEAVRHGDHVAVRRWLAGFLQEDCDPDGGRLLAHIIVEAARNERIASLFRHADRRIKACLSRAIAALAPAAPEAGRGQLVDIMMAILLGLPHRRLAQPDIDLAGVLADFYELVEREIHRLNESASPPA